MKVCKTLFGRINRPSQSCSRFARLGCEICLTLLDAKKCSSPYGCRSWNIFLLSVGQVLLSPLRRRYLHQCQLQCLLVLRFDPRKRVQSSKLPVFRNCAGFSIVAPAFLCRLFEPFPVPSLSSPDTGVVNIFFCLAVSICFTWRSDRRKRASPILNGSFPRTVFARLACFTTERNDACIESMQFSAAVCFAYRRHAEICTVDCPIAGSLDF